MRTFRRQLLALLAASLLLSAHAQEQYSQIKLQLPTPVVLREEDGPPRICAFGSDRECNEASSTDLDRLMSAFHSVTPLLLSRAQKTAQSYLQDDGKSTQARIESAIRWGCSINGGAGFLTSAGGITTSLALLPVGLVVSLGIQYQIVATVAAIRGFDLTDSRVHTLLFAVLAADTSTELFRQLGSKGGNFAATKVLGLLASTAGASSIHRVVGSALIAKAGEKSVSSLLGLSIPVLGGLVGAFIDTTACLLVAAKAQEFFLGPAFLDDPMNVWDVSETCQWLSNNDLPQHMAAFRRHRIDGPSVLVLTVDQLVSLGIPLKDASKIITLRDLHLKNHPLPLTQ